MQAWLVGVGIALTVVLLVLAVLLLVAAGYFGYCAVKFLRILNKLSTTLDQLHEQVKAAVQPLAELRGFTEGLAKIATDEIKSVGELRLAVEDFRKALFSFAPRRPLAREFSAGTEEEARSAEVAREEQLKQMQTLVPTEGAKNLGEVS